MLHPPCLLTARQVDAIRLSTWAHGAQLTSGALSKASSNQKSQHNTQGKAKKKKYYSPGSVS
jgi:hypothetical protein